MLILMFVNEISSTDVPFSVVIIRLPGAVKPRVMALPPILSLTSSYLPGIWQKKWATSPRTTVLFSSGTRISAGQWFISSLSAYTQRSWWLDTILLTKYSFPPRILGYLTTSHPPNQAQNSDNWLPVTSCGQTKSSLVNNYTSKQTGCTYIYESWKWCTLDKTLRPREQSNAAKP